MSRRVCITAAIALAVATAGGAAEFPPPGDLPPVAQLPSPLVARDGTTVPTRDAWAALRRPELRELFLHYMYGQQPEAPAAVAGRTLFEDAEAFGGAGALKEVELTFGPPEWPKIRLLVAIPRGARRPPCFVGCNFGGNHLLTVDPRVAVPTAWIPPRYGGPGEDHVDMPRGAHADAWPIQAILQRGYAVATFYCGDVQPDRPDVREGMRATLPAPSAAAAQPDDQTATIMWWAWGLSRAADYLVTDPAIDGARLATVGHSRLGKTALLAGALDERFAAVIANQAGCGGSAPSRTDNPRAETVALITERFPHWFCANFREFAADPTRLPFDQNGLVALCAPRPVLFTAAVEDQWANPAGQFAVLQAASPVYELLGVDGAPPGPMPGPGAPVPPSRLAFWLREGQHAMTGADWAAFLDFADRWLK